MADTTTFYPLLHGMLRSSSEPTEVERASKVMHWATTRTAAIGNVLHADENILITHAYRHWLDFKAPVSRFSLEELVRKERYTEGPLRILKEYDNYCSHTATSPDAIDMEVHLRNREQDWKKSNFIDLMRKSASIAESGEMIGKETLQGFEDARNYLLQELYSKTFSGQAASQGGSMDELADKILPSYNNNLLHAKAGNLTIKTGIPFIDQEAGGFDRKTLNLILGYAGHRKSSVARTIALNAATHGFRVLFIPLEFSVEEETNIFAMMHAHSKSFDGTAEYSHQKFKDGLLSDNALNFLRDKIIPHLKTSLGDLLNIWQPEEKTWKGIQGLIMREYAVAPIHLVTIDHLGLIDVSAERDQRLARSQMIKEMKDMALNYDNNRGMTFVNPAQSTRKGYEIAKANEGRYDLDAIAENADYERSSDSVCYAFLSDELKSTNEMKIGFCKARRAGTIDPQTIMVDPNVGIVGGSPQEKPRQSSAIRSGSATQKDSEVLEAMLR